jgi:hypothetical protein
MLARLVDTLPVGAHGVYEPKVDGYRGRIETEGSRVSIISRNDRPLTDRFPGLVAALRAALPSQCVIDGEIVSPAGAGVSFSAAVTSRLEAIAIFLALLEMLKRGEIQVEPSAAGVLAVSLVPSSQVAARSDDGTSSCGAGVETPPASAEVGLQPEGVKA